MTAVTTAPSTTAVLFTAFAGIAFVVVVFFYGASR
jgi:hypothetical protein